MLTNRCRVSKVDFRRNIRKELEMVNMKAAPSTASCERMSIPSKIMKAERRKNIIKVEINCRVKLTSFSSLNEAKCFLRTYPSESEALQYVVSTPKDTRDRIIESSAGSKRRLTIVDAPPKTVSMPAWNILLAQLFKKTTIVVLTKDHVEAAYVSGVGMKSTVRRWGPWALTYG